MPWGTDEIFFPDKIEYICSYNLWFARLNNLRVNQLLSDNT